MSVGGVVESVFVIRVVTRNREAALMRWAGRPAARWRQDFYDSV